MNVNAKYYLNTKMTKGHVEIKKRCYDWEHEIITELREPDYIPNSFGDRFIARRYQTMDTKKQCTKYKISRKEEYKDLLKMSLLRGYWRLDEYRLRINLQFDFASYQNRLNFHDVATETSYKKVAYEKWDEMSRNFELLDWPCYPRKKPVAFTDSTHDLPDFQYFSHLKIISWSKRGKLAASFGKDLVLWVPQSDSTIVYNIHGIKALTYNKSGNLLAIGVNKCSFRNSLQIWNVENDSIFIMDKVNYVGPKPDQIRCIEWEKNDKYLICGMQSGLILVHTYPKLQIIRSVYLLKCLITNLKFSTNQTYLAATDASGKIIIFKWKPFKIHSQTAGNRPHIAWHPWKENYLIIAYSMPAQIILVNVESMNRLAYYRRSDKACIIDAIDFNPISAELVVSFYIKEVRSYTNEVFVMSSMTNIVDLLDAHDSRVRFMMWNPDGTELATASDDQTLNIWNFLVDVKHSKQYIPKQSKKGNFGKKFSLINSFLQSR